MAKILLFNKPYGVISQFSGDEHITLKDYINLPGFYPAGRLDKDSEGLLLLTNDGRLQQKLSNPRHNKEKHYWVQVEGEPTQDKLDKLRRGITLKDGPCLPAKVQIIDEPSLWERNPPVRFRRSIPTTWLNIILSEGRNRQVRRMTAAIGYPTLRLVRHKIDQWHLGNLQPGEYRIIR